MINTATGYGDPTHALNPFNANDHERILRAEADKEQDILTKTWKKLTDSQIARADAEQKALAPLWAVQDKQIAAEAARERELQGKIPEWKPPPTINPGEAQSFVMGTLAVALIAGLAGKAGWMRVTEYMTGSIQGLIEGDRQRAEDYYRAYRAQYEASMGALKTQQERWRNILYATDVPINRIQKEAEIQAKIDGAEEKWLQAQQGHIDKLRGQAQAEEKMAIGIDSKRAALETQIEISLSRLAGGRAALAMGNNLDDYGKWAAAKVAAGGNTQLLATLTTRWASPQRAEIWNMMAKEMYETGADPAVINENQIRLNVERAAQRWSTVRWQATLRLEESLIALERPMEQAIIQANGLGPRAVNSPMNKVISEFGAGPHTERVAAVRTLAYTIGREYATLATMPVSNAQMHWGAQEKADRMVSGDMSLAELRGFYNSVLQEITVNKKALRDATELSMKDVISLGGQVNPQDYGLPPRDQASQQEDWIKRYGPPATQPTTH